MLNIFMHSFFGVCARKARAALATQLMGLGLEYAHVSRTRHHGVHDRVSCQRRTAGGSPTLLEDGTIRVAISSHFPLTDAARGPWTDRRRGYSGYARLDCVWELASRNLTTPQTFTNSGLR